MKKIITLVALLLITVSAAAQTQTLPGKLRVKVTDEVTVTDSLVVRASDGLFQHIKFTDLVTQLVGTGSFGGAGNIFEKSLVDAENNINVGFNLQSTTLVYYNGKIVPSSLWSGIGTQVINLSLDTKQYDLLTVKN